MWLNVAISALALASTLAAFGGETWRRGTEPFIERVTIRGWLSLTCLLVAFALGLLKEERANAAQSASTARESELTDNVKRLGGELSEKTTELSQIQGRLENTQSALEVNVQNLSDARFMRLEIEFQSLSAVNKQYFHGLTYLRRTGSQDVIDDSGHPLVIYAGDAISAVLDAKPSSIVGLQIGSESYQLDPPSSLGARTTQFAAKGNHSEAMTVRIINPEKASGSIKWFVTANTTVRQDQEFKKLLATTQVPDRIKAMYVIVDKPGAAIHRTPDASSEVIERPEPGFLVKRILSANSWSEIQMPGGKMGWIADVALSSLE